MKKFVYILLFSLGTLQIILSAIVCDSITDLVKLQNVDTSLSVPVRFSELRCDSVCTDVIVINPVVEVPVIQYENEDF